MIMSLYRIPIASWGIAVEGGTLLSRAACEHIAAQAIGTIIDSPVPTPTKRWFVLHCTLEDVDYIPGAGCVLAHCLPADDEHTEN